MSFFGSLFGNDQANAITQANNNAQAYLTQGKNDAIGTYNAALPQAQNYITNGYGAGNTAINNAITGAMGSLQSGYGQARNDLTGNYGAAQDTLNQYLGRATNTLNPLIAQGNTYSTMLGNALGANGAGAQSDFYNQYVNNNKTFNAADQIAADELQSQLNAQGISGGRAGALLERQGAQNVYARTQDYLNRLQIGRAHV